MRNPASLSVPGSPRSHQRRWGAADSFTVRARTTLTHAPIGVLKSSTRGWRDLVVTTGGGGAPAGRTVLAFQGQRYPGNPTVAPARPLTGEQKPEILITGR